MFKMRILFLICALCGAHVFAQTDKAPPAMSYITEWDGPFRDTRIVKLVDQAEGVACYVMLPLNVPTTSKCEGNGKCGLQYPAGIGSISCVKVSDTAKPASTTKAR